MKDFGLIPKCYDGLALLLFFLHTLYVKHLNPYSLSETTLI